MPTGKGLGLSGPMPVLDLQSMLGNRIRHFLILWDQPARRLCAPAAGLLAGGGCGPSRAYEGIRVEPELLAETWLKTNARRRGGGRERKKEEWRCSSVG